MSRQALCSLVSHEPPTPLISRVATRGRPVHRRSQAHAESVPTVRAIRARIPNAACGIFSRREHRRGLGTTTQRREAAISQHFAVFSRRSRILPSRRPSSRLHRRRAIQRTRLIDSTHRSGALGIHPLGQGRPRNLIRSRGGSYPLSAPLYPREARALPPEGVAPPREAAAPRARSARPTAPKGPAPLPRSGSPTAAKRQPHCRAVAAPPPRSGGPTRAERAPPPPRSGGPTVAKRRSCPPPARLSRCWPARSCVRDTRTAAAAACRA